MTILKTFTEHPSAAHFGSYHKGFCGVNICRESARFAVSKDCNVGTTLPEDIAGVTYLLNSPLLFH